jgi:hypothetical protein
VGRARGSRLGEPGQLVVAWMPGRQEAWVPLRVSPRTTLPLVAALMRNEPDAAISLSVVYRAT